MPHDTAKVRRWILLIGLLLGPRLAHAESPATRPSLFDPARHMKVSEVAPGMRGYGLSVFSGSKVERFDVEVISVLKNFNTAADVVLIRCEGAMLEHTGTVAGMSGSPIYLTDSTGRTRMIGAFAYGWQFSKDPIAGVQPIEYMLQIPEPSPATMPADGQARAMRESPRSGRRWQLFDNINIQPGTLGAHIAWRDQQREARPASVLTDGHSAHLTPLATPLAVSGLSPQFQSSMSKLFRSAGLAPLDGVNAGAIHNDNLKFEPGGVLALPLMTGDLDMTAIGTVTEVIGERVFGFGHPFNAEGPVSLPMAPGEIATIIANVSMSFKLGAPGKISGTLNADEVSGVAGRIGASPPMIPVEFRVEYADRSVDKTYHFKSVVHPRFTPVLANAALQSALLGARDLPQHHTISYDITIDFANGQRITSSDYAVDVGAEGLFYEFGAPLLVAADNPFQNVLPSKIAGTVRISPDVRSATILSVNIPHLRLRPGQPVRGYVTYRPYLQSEATMPIEIPLPADLPDGQYQLTVGDWMRYVNDERTLSPFRFSAENVDEMFAVLRDFASIKRSALYVRLLRQSDGVAVGRTAMPKLPSSRRTVLMGAGRSDVTPFVSSALTVIPTDTVLQGSADFTVTIDKNAQADAPEVRNLK